jgi:tRNA A-37 threonylcarbamoyl transferase component Bud32
MTGHVFEQGTVVSERFRVEKLLGAGGYGEVYLAEQLSMGRRVALKVLRAHLAHKETALDRFRNEARFACKLRNPHTVVYHDFGDDPELGVFWLAMEYLEGWSLEQRLRAEGVLSLEDCADILDGVAGSLHEAHELGLVHRDIKPANIMLVQRGNNSNYVKVIDFGIAKSVTAEASDGEHSLTETGTVLGSPSYMAPEQIRREHAPMGPYTDVYALSVMLYRLLTGVLPFRGATPIEVAMAHLTADAPRLGSLGDVAAPPALERLLLEALSRDVRGRPQTAEAFARRFRAAIDLPIPSSVTPTGLVQDPEEYTLEGELPLPEAAGGWNTRHKTQLMLTVAVILLGFALIVGLGAVGMQKLLGEQPPDEASPVLADTGMAAPTEDVALAGAGETDTAVAELDADGEVPQEDALTDSGLEAETPDAPSAGKSRSVARADKARRAAARAAESKTPAAEAKTPADTKAASAVAAKPGLVSVRISADPWGHVSVAGKTANRTLVTQLAPGTYTVTTLQRANGTKRTHRIKVTAGGRTSWRLNASP